MARRSIEPVGSDGDRCCSTARRRDRQPYSTRLSPFSAAIASGCLVGPDLASADRGSFMKACLACGVKDFRSYDLRHTAASWMRTLGADIHTVAQLLGHRTFEWQLGTSICPRPFWRVLLVSRMKCFRYPRRTRTAALSSRDLGVTSVPGWTCSQAQLVEKVGSVIGARTRTLRLERATC